MRITEGYGLKQVKVRLQLAEAELLYSTERITTPDKVTEVMAQALAQVDREYCCVVNLNGANRPINFNVVRLGILIRHRFQSRMSLRAPFSPMPQRSCCFKITQAVKCRPAGRIWM